MGVIEGGSASGQLPSDRLFAVNFPGYPQSLERATQALGGEDRIAESRSAEGNYLELKFRPEDPCAHAAFGELSQTSDLLLRIRRRRRCQSLPRLVDANVDTEAPPVEDNAEDYETAADIVARVEHTYNFEGMADYQYVLSAHADVARRRQKREREKQGLGNLMDVEQDELMMLVPPLFSIKDMPEDTVMRPSDFTNKKAKRTETPVKSQANLMPCFAVDFKIAEVPAPLKWEDQLVKESMEYNLTAATVKLFEERPIWAKLTLLDRLADFGVVITDAYVKRLLFRTGYYFGYGPFRTLWIRNGYDPRRDPESRLYQMMDFRIPRALRDGTRGPQRPLTKESGPAWRDICTFKAAPIKKFSFLQLYDLQDDYIQEQIRKPAERPTCSEYTGWFKRSTLDKLRDHIRARFMGLMPDEVARELQGLPRQSWAPSSKKVTWKDDENVVNNDDDDVASHPSHPLTVDETGADIQTPSDLTFTPLPDTLSQEEPEPEAEVEVEIPAVEADSEADATGDAAEVQAEEEEEEESDEDEEEEEDKEEEEDEDEEDEEEEEEDDLEIPQQSQDEVLEADEMPDGFLKELLGQYPFGQGYGEAGAEEDDGEYAIYEQADDDDDDDD